jgi:hypothetical protein
LLPENELKPEFGQVEYEKRTLEKKLSRWHIMSKGDLSLYAITGYESAIVIENKY